MTQPNSNSLFERAKKVIPGGVNSPVRAFASVGGNPLFMQRASGPYMWDADGNRYIDYVGSWGPFILGHSDPRVVEAIRRQSEVATSFGAPTRQEIEMAERLIEHVPSMEMVRMVNSGTEATMSAIRLARGFTRRSKIIKFEGCYHGHGDSFLIKAGSGALTLGQPSSPGITEGTAQDTLNARYNDLPSVQALVDANPDQIAAIIIEPVAGNMGVVASRTDFLQGLRRLCDTHGIVLIFDEVMSGFRVALGGAQALYGITPDMTTLGKIIGGGLPVGAFGGKREIMEMLAPLGPIYQAGTLSGNPLAMAAGIETIDAIATPGFYDALNNKAEYIEQETAKNLKEFGIRATQNRVGSMLCLFFTEAEVVDYESATTSNTNTYATYFRSMLDAGVYLAPSQYEAMFVSIAHSEDVLAQTMAAQRRAFELLASTQSA